MDREKLTLIHIEELLKAINQKEKESTTYLAIMIVLMVMNVCLTIAWIAIFKTM